MANRTDTQSVINLVINGQQAQTTLRQLTDTQRRLNTEIRNMRPSDPGYNDRLRELQMINRALEEQRRRLRGVVDESAKLATNWKEVTKGIIASTGIDFGINGLKSLGKEIFEVTAKYQKLEAVLTTTLGSNLQAKSVMGQLENFAAVTPFGVDELTASYVKLANQGFKPTLEQLRKLGDLSASTGKNFDQLTEAIIDAQTGEFERLKEFGIRASKEGDKVTFTFKGVAQQVDFTASSIRDYITSLGDAEGISGSMEAISETLSGKVSNLEDSWESLLKTVGEETTGVFSGAIDIMSNAIETINTYIKNLNIAQKYNASGAGWKERIGGFFSEQSGGVNLSKVKMNAFAQVSNTLDQQIGDAKYHSQLNGILKDLNERMSKLDRTTRDGAAAFQLYNDKKKMLVDKANAIDAEREQKTLEKASEARKKGIKEAEKLQKEQEKEAKKAAAERKKLDEDLAKNKETLYQNSLENDDKEVAAIQDKYAKLKERAKGNKTVLLEIQNQEGTEMLALIKKQKEERIKEQEKYDEETKKINEEEFEKVLKNANSIQDENKSKLKENFSLELNGVNTEEAAAKLKETYQQREREMTAAHFELLKAIYKAFGKDATDIDRQITEQKLKNAEEELQKRIETTQEQKELETAKKDFITQTAQEAANAVFTIVSNNARAQNEANLSKIEKEREQELSNKNLTEEQKNAINAKYDQKVREEKKRAWQAEQKAAIAQAVINGALAVTKAWAEGTLLAPFIIPGIVASTALQIGVIAAQKMPEFAKGVRNYKGGTALVGEAGQEIIEEQNKWWLTDGPTVANLAPGANVYTATETTDILKNNLYPVKNYSIDTTGAMQAERSYRSNTTTPANNNSPATDFGEIKAMIAQLAAMQQAESEKKVVLEYKTFDEFKKKIETAYNRQVG